MTSDGPEPLVDVDRRGSVSAKVRKLEDSCRVGEDAGTVMEGEPSDRVEEVRADAPGVDTRSELTETSDSWLTTRKAGGSQGRRGEGMEKEKRIGLSGNSGENAERSETPVNGLRVLRSRSVSIATDHSAPSPAFASRDIPSTDSQSSSHVEASDVKPLDKKVRTTSTESECVESYAMRFPDTLDDYFRSFDDNLIKKIQWRTDGNIKWFSWFFTALTSIESSLPFPFILFSLGYDIAGTAITTIIFTLTILSQLPKRFLWRTRPWVNGRAKKVRTDSTSSFPSRGVICGIVFPLSTMYAWELETGRSIHWLVKATSVTISVICTSFARINVGAHYPSDTIFGIVMGFLVQRMGVWAMKIWNHFGSPSSPEYMYADLTSRLIVRGSFWSLLPLGRLLFAAWVSFALTIVTMRSFWLKCNYVYGLLLPCFSFRYVFLSASSFARGTSLAPLPRQSFGRHFLVMAVGMLFLAYGMKTRGKKGKLRIINYLLLYIVSFGAAIYFRL